MMASPFALLRAAMTKCSKPISSCMPPGAFPIWSRSILLRRRWRQKRVASSLMNFFRVPLTPRSMPPATRFFFSSRRRHTRCSRDWSSDVCSSDLAALSTFPVAAKTGTARRVVNGRYAPGQYTASFAALFPADHPQLVLVVKIDNPHKGSYFAAQTAAPVTRSMLEQALAARTVALDRARLSTAAPRAAAAPVDDDGGLVPYVVPWPYQPDSAGVGPRRAVPDVAGFGMREAVRALHRRGFRVALRGWGVAEHTWPAAGDSAAAGSMVTLFADPHAGDRVRARGAAPPRRGARP